MCRQPRLEVHGHFFKRKNGRKDTADMRVKANSEWPQGV